MRIGNVSFGATYAIKYNYTLMKAYGYATPDNNVRSFISTYNNYIKGNDDISAINPETKTYFIKISDRNSKLFDMIAQDFKIKSKIRKVDDKKIEGAVITSVGQTRNEDEVTIISDKIGEYEYNKHIREDSIFH